jgi:hypothetical protein
MLTREDNELLHQALDALQAKGGTHELLGVMITVLLSPSKNDAQERLAEYECRVKTKSHEQQTLEERIILVKAKLIQMRDVQAVDSLMRTDKGGR